MQGGTIYCTIKSLYCLVKLTLDLIRKRYEQLHCSIMGKEVVKHLSVLAKSVYGKCNYTHKKVSK